jgi:hypothetical protein
VTDFAQLARTRYGLTKAVYGVASLRQVLDAGETKVRALLKSGELPSFWDGQRRVVTVASLAEFLWRRENAAAPPAKATAIKDGHPPEKSGGAS